MLPIVNNHTILVTPAGLLLMEPLHACTRAFLHSNNSIFNMYEFTIRSDRGMCILVAVSQHRRIALAHSSLCLLSMISETNRILNARMTPKKKTLSTISPSSFKKIHAQLYAESLLMMMTLILRVDSSTALNFQTLPSGTQATFNRHANQHSCAR